MPTNFLIHLCFSACGPGTAGVGRPAIKCPAVATWVDGFNTSIPESQGTIQQQLKAAGLALNPITLIYDCTCFGMDIK